MNIAVLLFNDVEELDFAGPFEVFAYMNKVGEQVNVYTVSEDGQEVRCANGLYVRPHYSFKTAPAADILLVPGGQGRKREMSNSAVLAYIRQAAAHARYIASVCTGAFILAAAGLFPEGAGATTHHLALEELKETFPFLFVTGERIMRHGNIYTAGGVSAGIDLALVLADRLKPGLGQKIAERIEYRRQGMVPAAEKVIHGGTKMRVGVISDTHIPTRARHLPPALFEIFRGVDLILHAGDVVEEQVLEELEALAPVEAVAGNMDPYLLASRLGRKKILQLGKFRIGMTHGDVGDGYHREKTPERAFSLFSQDRVDCIVFGHTHRPYKAYMNGVLLFNPGSPTDRRREPRCSVGLLTVDESGIEAEHVYL